MSPAARRWLPSGEMKKTRKSQAVSLLRVRACAAAGGVHGAGCLRLWRKRSAGGRGAHRRRCCCCSLVHGRTETRWSAQKESGGASPEPRARRAGRSHGRVRDRGADQSQAAWAGRWYVPSQPGGRRDGRNAGGFIVASCHTGACICVFYYTHSVFHQTHVTLRAAISGGIYINVLGLNLFHHHHNFMTLFIYSLALYAGF